MCLSAFTFVNLNRSEVIIAAVTFIMTKFPRVPWLSLKVLPVVRESVITEMTMDVVFMEVITSVRETKPVSLPLPLSTWSTTF